MVRVKSGITIVILALSDWGNFQSIAIKLDYFSFCMGDPPTGAPSRTLGWALDPNLVHLNPPTHTYRHNIKP